MWRHPNAFGLLGQASAVHTINWQCVEIRGISKQIFQNQRSIHLFGITLPMLYSTLQWRHNDRGGVSSHRRFDCLLNRLIRRRSTKTSKLCVTGLWEANPPVTGGFPSQRASNAEKCWNIVKMIVEKRGLSWCQCVVINIHNHRRHRQWLQR